MQAAVAKCCAAHAAGLAWGMAGLERNLPKLLALVRADQAASPAVQDFHTLELVHFWVALAGQEKRAKGWQLPAPAAWAQVWPARSGISASFMVTAPSRIRRHVHPRRCLCAQPLHSVAPPTAAGASGPPAHAACSPGFLRTE